MADELRRLYLEPTSRCNLNCAMCFRKSWVDEEAGDMDEATFRAVLAHLPPGVETLFFGGMGEPLFHPHITDMVRAASAAGLASCHNHRPFLRPGFRLLSQTEIGGFRHRHHLQIQVPAARLQIF